jgi:MFS family permease
LSQAGLDFGKEISLPVALRPAANRTLGLLLLAALTFSVSQTMMNPALSVIETRFNASQTTVAWTLSAFFIMAALSPSIVGRLGDMFGKKRALVLELIVFCAGAIACALAPTISWLIAGRVLMGAGAGIFPLAYSIVRDELEPRRVPAAIGLIAAMIGVGIAFGFPIGGLMIDHLGLPSTFWTTAVMAAITAIAIAVLVPESPIRTPGRVDVPGAVLLAAGLVLALLAISRASELGWLAPATVGLAASGAVILTIFARFELAQRNPLIDVRVLASRPVLANNVATILIGFGGVGAFVLVPLLAQMPRSTGYGLGETAAGSGLLMLPCALLTFVAATVSGRLIGRLGTRNVLIAATALTAASIGGLAFSHSTALLVAFWPAFFGFGTGLAYASLPILIVESVPQHMTGEATGVNSVLRNIGFAIGVQVGTTLLATNLIVGSNLTSDLGYTLAFAGCAVACLGSAVIACFIPYRRRLEAA